MAGPMASFTYGHKRLTACAITWELVCQKVFRYSGFSKVYRISILFSSFLFGEGKKQPTPDNSGVGYKVFHGSTLVASCLATHWRYNGRTRQDISSLRLRSGIAPISNKTLSPNRSLSGKPIKARVSSSQLLDATTIPYILQIVNPYTKVEDCRVVKGVIFHFSGVKSRKKLQNWFTITGVAVILATCYTFSPILSKFDSKHQYLVCNLHRYGKKLTSS